MAVALLLGAGVGCNEGARDEPSAAPAPHGPHGGHWADMSDGAGFGVEFTLDEARRRVVLYVRQENDAGPHPLAATELSGRFEANGSNTDVTFAAEPLPSDPEGHASRFVLAWDRLPQQLLTSDRFVLELAYAVDGKTITASIPHANDHAHEYRHD